MRILFFAQLKDVTGCGSVDWEEVGSLTAAELWRRLERQWPALRAHREVTRLARNCEFVGDDATFDTGDEVALIPPVSGG